VEIDVAFQLNGRDRRLDTGGTTTCPPPLYVQVSMAFWMAAVSAPMS
jgi:hypothetical protein